LKADQTGQKGFQLEKLGLAAQWGERKREGDEKKLVGKELA